MKHKFCKVCGKLLYNGNKSGYCVKHLPRTGKNNPFYGKTHSKEVREVLSSKCAEATRKKWEDAEYRNRVITGATGKKRSEEFKETQRKNALKQFQDENQRKIRAEKMHESWITGKIIATEHPSYNCSKIETLFFEMLQEKLPITIKRKEILRYKDKNGDNKYLYPDGVIEEYKIIIEFQGAFWHASPSIYLPEDIVHHDYTAQFIWDRDEEKKKILESLGYVVIYAWDDDFKPNKEKYIETFIQRLYNKINEFS